MMLLGKRHIQSLRKASAHFLGQEAVGNLQLPVLVEGRVVGNGRTMLLKCFCLPFEVSLNPVYLYLYRL